MSDHPAEVVVAIDGSDNCHRALVAGADLADAMGRELGLLYVLPGNVVPPDGGPASSQAQHSNQRESQSHAIFSAALAELGSRRRPVRQHLLRGDPAAEIIDFMAANPHCHLVMGRRGLSKIQALVMGSVSDKVMRHAKGLVTVVS